VQIAIIVRSFVGIFSLFGKKERQSVDTPADDAPSRKKREEAAQRVESPSDTEIKTVQRKVARATALKIDAIESEMSSEFVRPQSSSSAKPAPQEVNAEEPENPPANAPANKGATEFLLGTETVYGAAVAISASEAAPVIEEAAILFANGQAEMVEQMLLGAIDEDALGNAAMTAWRMLFDLYQIADDRVRYDNLSIEYANKFETSPPPWIEPLHSEASAANVAPSGAAPTVSFSGALDTGIVKQLEKAQNLAEKSRVLRLEFARVTTVDPIGCGLLLSILKKLQKSGHDLILVGAFELADKIRAILEVGRRDETEAPWLLLLEILRLLNFEKEFEEASIDYCVTFEVSPPAFEAPRNKVTTAIDETPPTPLESKGMPMPAVIADGADKLISRIATYAEQHRPAIIDCTQLKRVSFTAAGELLTGLAPLAAKGADIELHNVNHLVTALFAVMGLKDIVRVVPRKS
jgi:anti-anti-sigma regulatory factor